MIRATCACGEVVNAVDELAGNFVKCRRCGRPVAVPRAAGDPFNVDTGGASMLRDLEPMDAIEPERSKRSIFGWPLILVWTLPLLLCCLLPFVSVNAPPSPPAEPPPIELAVGVDALITGEGKTRIGGCTVAAYRAVQKAARADDAVGLAELLANDDAIQVPVGTRVRVLEIGDDLAEVRIFQGEHAFKSGWFARDALYPVARLKQTDPAK